MRRLNVNELKQLSGYEFGCNMTEELRNYNTYDAWGCAFIWVDNIGVEYNFCVDNGENCSGIYRMEWHQKDNETYTDYSCSHHYEIDFNDNTWEHKLEDEMCQTLIDMYMLMVNEDQKVIDYFDTICNVLNKSFYERENISKLVYDGLANISLQNILIDLCDKVTNKKITYINKGEKIMNTVTREEIVKELNKMGYQVELTQINKNGVQKQGFCLQSDNTINPVVYVEDNDLQEKTMNEIIKILIEYFKLSFLGDINYIIKNIRVGLQKCGNENIVKCQVKELEGIESYLFLNVFVNGANRTVKLPKDYSKTINVGEHYLWEMAKINTFNNTTIKSIMEEMCEILGLEYNDSMESNNVGKMYVLTNKEKFRGAAGVLDKELLKTFAKKHNTNKIVLIPSSIDEFIIIPYGQDNDFTLEEITQMVKEVNTKDVLPEEQLSDRAYIYNV